jgi:NADH-quinone oxidoreductase subunit M
MGGNVGLLRVISVLAVAGVVLGAWYMLRLIERVFFGPLREPKIEHHGDAASHAPSAPSPPADLCSREIFALAPLAAVILWIGVWPEFFLAPMRPAVDRLGTAAAQAVEQQTVRAAQSDIVDRETP